MASAKEALYGRENAFSGLYVITCLNNSLDADLFLMEDGVYAAVADQISGAIRYPNVKELTYLIFLEKRQGRLGSPDKLKGIIHLHYIP
ncbi:hypothetical protein [Methanomethylovorans sp.]|uniref:hypothetical protein n=1 Tax=Methanomethylovorans sp. TaxID=2758717 RepID=UPI003D0B90A1